MCLKYLKTALGQSNMSDNDNHTLIYLSGSQLVGHNPKTGHSSVLIMDRRENRTVSANTATNHKNVHN